MECCLPQSQYTHTARSNEQQHVTKPLKMGQSKALNSNINHKFRRSNVFSNARPNLERQTAKNPHNSSPPPRVRCPATAITAPTWPNTHPYPTAQKKRKKGKASKRNRERKKTLPRREKIPVPRLNLRRNCNKPSLLPYDNRGTKHFVSIQTQSKNLASNTHART